MSCLDADRSFGAVEHASAGGRLEAQGHVDHVAEDVALVVKVEQLGCLRVATAVAGAPAAVDDDPHRNRASIEGVTLTVLSSK